MVRLKDDGFGHMLRLRSLPFPLKVPDRIGFTLELYAALPEVGCRYPGDRFVGIPAFVFHPARLYENDALDEQQETRQGQDHTMIH